MTCGKGIQASFDENERTSPNQSEQYKNKKRKVFLMKHFIDLRGFGNQKSTIFSFQSTIKWRFLI
ncbi:MAG: hypothetical protein ACJAWV_000449 [Flammeovirgaceae bacterium]